jgi:hypothetical protein
MSDDEWVSLALLLWQQCWRYGTQNDRRELPADLDHLAGTVVHCDGKPSVRGFVPDEGHPWAPLPRDFRASAGVMANLP